MKSVRKGFYGLSVVLAVLSVLMFSGVNAWSEINEEFIEAVITGDINQVKVLLNKGADVNAKDEAGQTALMWATITGHITGYTDMAKLLINKGALVFSKAITWGKTFGGSGWSAVYSIAQTSDGGYVVVGITK